MDQIKQHFDEEAQKFDRIIQQLIPHYGEMLQALSIKRLQHICLGR